MYQSTMLTCQNPLCHSLYSSNEHGKGGKAVKRGKTLYCTKECAEAHTDMLKEYRREQP